MCMAPCWVALIWAVSAWAAGPAGAEAKFHALETGSYPRGARVQFTTGEIDAYLRKVIPEVIGPGVRNVRIEAGMGNVVRGFADIDFLRVRQAHGEKPNWLITQLLAGERPVEITVRITSGHGDARVDVVRVAISGVVAEGRTLAFLITNFVLPTFPDIKVGKSFALAYDIDRLEVRPGLVTVVRK
jgi:hypothetical protein